MEPLSIGGHAVVRGAPTAADRALVVGAGPIGLGITAFLAAVGVQPVVCDVSAERRAFAAAWAGVVVGRAHATTDRCPRTPSAASSPTLVFDATGSAASMHASFALVAHGGRLVFVGLFQGDVTFHDPDFHRRELTLIASRNATASDFERSVAMLESGPSTSARG